MIVPIVTADYAHITETLLNQDPDPANPGEYVEIRWKIEKEGNAEIEDLTYYLEVNYPFSFDASDKPQKVIGDWFGKSDSDEFYTLYYKIKVDEGALEGTYEIKLKSKDSKFNPEWSTEEYEIRVSSSIPVVKK